ncbi:CBS domain-containing protein [Pseudodesulfovibrio senegalensis]|uniref:CBS domain-containing protein n=1 Tax=Pseudodesulfovibrio senegalensis TaxID=1721087 RepID=A0A6N6MZU1_9BACT|nr:CBS domain-containing protein [Pseudodesulfovibrio senegalensis]KAB1441143.1 CBS domain-containing protein [Pseudodesulfovibrio senegalensis]
MLKARDIMTEKAITLKPDTDIVSAVKTLLENKINGVPVVEDDGSVIGVLTQSDLVAQQKELKLPSFFTLLDGVFPLSSYEELDKQLQKISAIVVREAMTPAPATVTPETKIAQIATIMADKKLYTLPVVENGKLIGVVGKEDVLRTLVQHR